MFNKNITISEEYEAIFNPNALDTARLSKMHSKTVIKDKKNIISYLLKETSDLLKEKTPDKVSFENSFYKIGKYLAGAAIAIGSINIICETFDIGSVSSSIDLNYENYMISFLEDINIYNKDLYNTIYNTKIKSADVILLSPAIPIISKSIGLMIDKSLSKIYDIIK